MRERSRWALCIGLLVWGAAGCNTTTRRPERNDMVTIQHLDPTGLHQNPAFTQAIAIEGPHRVVYVGGQNAVDAGGNLVGEGDLVAQTEQVFHNLQVALAAAGARLEDLVKTNVYLVQGQDPRPAFEVSRRYWKEGMKPPTLCVLQVAGLAHPAFLLEIEGVAVVALRDGRNAASGLGR